MATRVLSLYFFLSKQVGTCTHRFCFIICTTGNGHVNYTINNNSGQLFTEGVLLCHCITATVTLSYFESKHSTLKALSHQTSHSVAKLLQVYSIPSIFLCKMCFLPLSKSMDFPIWLHAFQHGGTYIEVYGTICVNMVSMMSNAPTLCTKVLQLNVLACGT